MPSDRESSLLRNICGAAVGLALGLAMLPLDFIAGNRGLWLQPKYDFFPYLIAWNYFLRDRWRMPLLDVPAMGYPEGGNLLYSDALPVAQLASKAIHSASGWAINPLGWWVLLTYVLQGVMAARVVRATGVRSPLGWMAAGLLVTGSVPFMTRIFHVALSSQFLILWAMALYFENTRDRRFSAGEHLFLSILTLLTNAYLFAMVAALQAVTVAVVWWRGGVAFRQIRTLVAGLAIVIAVGILIGYGRFFADPASMRAGGFGIYSWNPATLVLPPVSHWDHHPTVPRLAIPEQAEGESYIGLGALLVVAAALLVLLWRPRQAAPAIRGHALFLLALLLFVLYALSHRIFVGPHLILAVPLPPAVENLGGFFRASGRFIWVPIYALVLLSLGVLLKWAPPRIAVPVVVLAIVAQVSEVRSTVQMYRPVLAGPAEDLLDVNQFRRWLARHRQLFLFPSFICQPARNADDTFRELQIQLLAARLNVPNNSIYTGRNLKDCDAEAAWSIRAELDAMTLYVLNKTAIEQSPALGALTESPLCVDVGWALICSRQPLRK